MPPSSAIEPATAAGHHPPAVPHRSAMALSRSLAHAAGRMASAAGPAAAVFFSSRLASLAPPGNPKSLRSTYCHHHPDRRQPRRRPYPCRCRSRSSHFPLRCRRCPFPRATHPPPPPPPRGGRTQLSSALQQAPPAVKLPSECSVFPPWIAARGSTVGRPRIRLVG